MLNFEDMKNQLCTNSPFIDSLQNAQSRFFIQLKFKPSLISDTNFMGGFRLSLLKTDVLVHKKECKL